MATVQASTFRVPARGRLLTGGAMVIGGTAIFQASNFLFNSIAARTLGPDKYGDLAAVVGLVYLASPFLLSIQTVASRTTTSLYAAGRARELRGLTRFYGFRLAFGAALVGALAVLFSGLVSQVLHLRSSLPVALLGAVFVLATLSHLQRGVVQGLQRFGALGVGSVLEGVGKVVAVVVLLKWVWPNESGAIFALVIASVFPIAFNGAILHRLPDTTERVQPMEHPYGYSLQTLGTLVLLAMLLSTDVIAANRYLSSQTAGLYAAVSLSGKTVFFATSALTAIAFPVFSHRQDRGEDSRWALLGLLGIVAVASAAIVGLYFAVPTILVHAIFGSRFAGASAFVPWMAIAFAGYSLVYLVGMYLLSQRRRIGAAILGVSAVAQLAGFRVYHADIPQLIGVQLSVLCATAATMTIAALMARGVPRAEISPAEESDEWQP
jgi:O-antigen/teichoic acid export membrane protein